MAFFQILPWKNCRCHLTGHASHESLSRQCSDLIIEKSGGLRCWGFLSRIFVRHKTNKHWIPRITPGLGHMGTYFLFCALCFTAPPPKKKKKLKNKETPVSASLSSSGSLITISNRGKVRSRHLEKILGAFLWLSYWCLPWQWAREGQVFASHERWCFSRAGNERLIPKI